MLPFVRLPLLGSPLSTYAIVRTVYVFVALWLTFRLNERQDIRASTTLGAFALGVPAGILGAHVLDMMEYWGQHGGLRDVLSPTGSSIYGAFLVVFPPASFAYRDQQARGLLPSGALHSLPVVPVQLVSAALALSAFVGLLWLFRRPHRAGAVLYAFLCFYGALRLGMAPLRQEALASMVIFSVGFTAVGTLGLLLGRRELPAPTKAARRLSPVR